MASVDDLDEVVEQYHLAAGEFVKGNPEPVKKLFSRREDATLTRVRPIGVGSSERQEEEREYVRRLARDR
jgi:hypothetical protein